VSDMKDADYLESLSADLESDGYLGDAERVKAVAARIRELERLLDERDLDIVDLAEDRNKWIAAGAMESRRATKAEQKLADRDAAWDRAIEVWWNCWTRRSNCKDFRADIREILEADGGES
jgi:hypothetical protein